MAGPRRIDAFDGQAQNVPDADLVGALRETAYANFYITEVVTAGQAMAVHVGTRTAGIPSGEDGLAEVRIADSDNAPDAMMVVGVTTAADDLVAESYDPADGGTPPTVDYRVATLAVGGVATCAVLGTSPIGTPYSLSATAGSLEIAVTAESHTHRIVGVGLTAGAAGFASVLLFKHPILVD